jgi:membrane protease YdiL (CAAX protease family)
LADGLPATNNRAVFIAATTENLPPEMQNSLMIFGYVVLGLTPVAVLVFSRLLWRIEHDGPRTRPDLFAMPEILAITMVFVLLFLPSIYGKLAAIFGWGGPPAQPPVAYTVDFLWKVMLVQSMPVVSVLLIAQMRGARLRDLFVPARVPFFRALWLGVGLGLAAFLLSTTTSMIVLKIVGTGEGQQKLVQGFETARSIGDKGVIWAITASAVLVAPICEEILFRGSLYPVLARVLGRGPSAMVVSALFALAHDTYSAAPSLAVLALCFTIAYEYSGTLLVPIFMHATFNGISLVQQWIR